MKKWGIAAIALLTVGMYVMQIQRLSPVLGDFVHLKARAGGGWQLSADRADSNLHGGLVSTGGSVRGQRRRGDGWADHGFVLWMSEVDQACPSLQGRQFVHGLFLF